MSARIALSTVAIMLAGSAQAQNLPNFFNTNDVEQRLPLPNLPIDSYRPTAPVMQLPAEPSSAQQLHMQSTFPVRTVRIEGGTLYSLQALAQVYEPLTGRQVSFAQLIDATRSITQRYHKDGYPLSFAYLPEQDFASGAIRVVLVEGFIAQVNIDADIGPVRKKLEAIADKMRGERPLTRKTFERYSSLLNTLPGVTAEVQVPPPTTSDGATTLHVRAQRKTVASSMNLSSTRGNSLQALLSASSQARTAWAERLTVSALLPPGKDHERYFRGDYNQHIGAEGTQLTFSASSYRADPADDINLGGGFFLSQHKQNDRLSASISHPLIAAPDRWWSLSAQLYAVNDHTRYELNTGGFKLRNDANVRALAVETDWRQNSARQLRLLSLGVYQGLNRFGAKTDNTDTDLAFFRLRLSAVQSDAYTEQIQGVISATGYWSNDHLPESEKAIFGGQNFARGYPADQASGDKGWGASYELNYSYLRDDSTWFKRLQPYIVFDTARTAYNVSALPASKMASAALGLRLSDNRYYNLSLEAAKPLAERALDSRNRSPRYSLSFSYAL